MLSLILELTLVLVQCHFSIHHFLQSALQPVVVFLGSVSKNNNIVNVTQDPFPTFKNVAHLLLKVLWGTTDAER